MCEFGQLRGARLEIQIDIFGNKQGGIKRPPAPLQMKLAVNPVKS